MSGKRLMVDTNAVVYYRAGTLDRSVADRSADEEVHISFITEIELRSFRGPDDTHRKAVARFIARSVVSEMNTPIKDRAVHFRLEYGLKTPDAIIAVTASYLGLPLVTADKAFGRVKADLTIIQVSA